MGQPWILWQFEAERVLAIRQSSNVFVFPFHENDEAVVATQMVLPFPRFSPNSF